MRRGTNGHLGGLDGEADGRCATDSACEAVEQGQVAHSDPEGRLGGNAAADVRELLRRCRAAHARPPDVLERAVPELGIESDVVNVRW